jgi:fibronectin type III domain protein
VEKIAIVAVAILVLSGLQLPAHATPPAGGPTAAAAIPTPSNPAPAAPPASPDTRPAAIRPFFAAPTVNYNASSAFGSSSLTGHIDNVATRASDTVWLFISEEAASGTPYIRTVTDNKSEAYTHDLNYTSATNGLQVWHIANVPATPSYRLLQVQVTPVGVINMTIMTVDVTGVNGTPVDHVGSVNTGTGTSCSSSVTSTLSFPELVLMGVAVASNPTVSATGGDTKMNTAAASNAVTGTSFKEAIASPAATTMSCTISISHTWASASVAIAPNPAPPAPTGLAVAGYTPTSVSLSWTQSTGGGIVNNTVFSSTRSSGPWTPHSTSGAATSFTVSSLSCLVTYYFQVASWNASGQSPNSSQVSQQTASGVGCVVYLCNLAAITTTLVYSNVTVVQQCGNVTVTTGSLTIDNATWEVWQNNSGTTTLAPDNHYLAMNNGAGRLTIKYSTFESANGSAYPSFLQVTAGSQFMAVHDRFLYLGAVTHPTNGFGVYVQVGHVDFDRDVFSQVFQVVFSGASAIGDSVTRSYAASNESFNANGNGLLSCQGGCSWFNVTNDTLNSAAANMEAVNTNGPHTTVYGCAITANITGTGSIRGVNVGSGGASAGQYLLVSHNTIQGGNIGVNIQSAAPNTTYPWYNITYNRINGTGQGTGSGTSAVYVTATNEGVGKWGIWISHLNIWHNTITNCTRDVIRVGSNVTLFNVSSNSITYDDGDGVPDNNESTNIYIIRGVNNGTVWNNTVVPWDYAWIYTRNYCVALESRIRNVNVSFNQCYNFTAGGYYNQGNPPGADSAHPWLAGPNLYNTFYRNRAIEYRDIRPARNTVWQQDCFEDWSWANGTQWVQNTCSYVPGQYNHGNYYGTGIRVSSWNNTYVGNTVNGAQWGIVVHRFSTGFENTSRYANNESYNRFINNTFTNIQGKVYLSDNSQGWPLSTNIMEGLVGTAGWNFSFVTASDVLWLGPSSVNVNYLNATGPLYSSGHIHFHGTTYLGLTGVTYTFNLSQYNTSRSRVVYAGLSLDGPTSGGGQLAVSVQSYSAGTGSVNFTASRTSAATVYINDTAAVTGRNYFFVVDGIVRGNQVASAGAVHFNWTAWSSHTFVIVADNTLDVNLVGGPPGLVGLLAALVALAAVVVVARVAGDWVAGTRGRRGGR